jgi:Transposase, Mutator family
VTKTTQSEVGEKSAARRLADTFPAETLDSLIADAVKSGTPIDGANGLLNELTKAVLERSLQSEMTHHLGYEFGDPAGRGSGNSRNGSTSKTVNTVNGPVEVAVPREPQRFIRAGHRAQEDPLTQQRQFCCAITIFAWNDDPRHRGAPGGGVRGVGVTGVDLQYH